MDILAAFAHPDDETRFPGGTLAEVTYKEESLRRAWPKGKSNHQEAVGSFLTKVLPRRTDGRTTMNFLYPNIHGS